MPLNRDYIGREFSSSGTYEVSREKIRDFAVAIGDPHPAYVDPDAAKALGYPDVIAPPTFLTVLNFRFTADSPIVDPGLGLDYALVVHGEQSFALRRPVRAGDVLRTVARIDDIRNAGRNEIIRLVTDVLAVDGEQVATVSSTIVSRGTAAATPED